MGVLFPALPKKGAERGWKQPPFSSKRSFWGGACLQEGSKIGNLDLQVALFYPTFPQSRKRHVIKKMQIALRATLGTIGLRGSGLGRSRDLRRPPRPGFGKGRSRRFRLPVAAEQSPAPFRGTRRADRIGTRAFRRARRRRTQVAFRPGGAASALLYNNRALRAGDALSSPTRPPPATPPSGSGAASVLSCLRVVPVRPPNPNSGNEGSRQGHLWLLFRSRSLSRRQFRDGLTGDHGVVACPPPLSPRGAVAAAKAQRASAFGAARVLHAGLGDRCSRQRIREPALLPAVTTVYA